ncbi:DUF3833 domain-containing protein [Shewanella marinintestina]|uniref:DUF3833 domain-containing protein n=1 Tax=Shewanella marinintestina TaxID=190305 RepID=UPI00200D1981|nr:DUF3833 domain-containing protein [Shewanella marinintestina]MCL1145012.1 DUF3833 domain-containing protein [Shewanella marinintestina]
MRLLNKVKQGMAAMVLLLLTACSSSDINDYQGTTPDLDLKQFFDGKLTAHGTVQDYSGKVVRRFTVDMLASWQGNQGEIKEWFIYDDGEKQIRIWKITYLGNGKYSGTANDILGEAEGQAVGMALQWEYEMMLPVDDTEYQVTFDDWMFLIDDNTIINRSDINKFGITMAEVTLVISKVE